MTQTVVDALRAIQQGDREQAGLLAAADESLLARALTRFLRAHPDVTGSVYTEPAAFQAFIAGGGNVGLYEATATALAAAYDRGDARTVLDLGSGDGAALVPAVTMSARPPERVELVELSAALLSTATERLRQLDVEVSTHETTAQQFAAGLTPGQHWDVAESTFALHTLPPAERDEVLRALRGHVGELVVVEFDVPDLAAGTDAHLQFLADSYEQGLREYGADRDLVADGFLVPVLIGQLAPDAARMTYEQTAAAWADQLERCGYTHVTRADLYPYWSSPAFVLTGRGDVVR
jgi:ubiquinone/menaquinone biosynthesis C-methylase UbiE